MRVILYFVNVIVIRFSCIKRHSFLMRWSTSHSCDRAFTLSGQSWLNMNDQRCTKVGTTARVTLVQCLHTMLTQPSVSHWANIGQLSFSMWFVTKETCTHGRTDQHVFVETSCYRRDFNDAFYNLIKTINEMLRLLDHLFYSCSVEQLKPLRQF